MLDMKGGCRAAEYTQGLLIIMKHRLSFPLNFPPVTTCTIYQPTTFALRLRLICVVVIIRVSAIISSNS